MGVVVIEHAFTIECGLMNEQDHQYSVEETSCVSQFTEKIWLHPTSSVDSKSWVTVHVKLAINATHDISYSSASHCWVLFNFMQYFLYKYVLEQRSPSCFSLSRSQSRNLFPSVAALLWREQYVMAAKLENRFTYNWRPALTLHRVSSHFKLTTHWTCPSCNVSHARHTD